MKRVPLTFLMALLSGVAIVPTSRAANTIQDFTVQNDQNAVLPDAIPVRTFDSTFNDGQGVMVIAGPDGGRAIQLTDLVENQDNGLALNQLVSGDYSKLEFDFDLSFYADLWGEESNLWGADGIGFTYANSRLFGSNNRSPFPNWAEAEEPNLRGSLGIGFDTYHDRIWERGALSPSVSLHYAGVTLYSTELVNPLGISTDSGEPIHVNVTVTPSTTGSSVSVKMRQNSDTITPISDFFVEGLLPYDGRAIFKGRTGDYYSRQTVDNFRVSLTSPEGITQTASESFDTLPLGPLAFQIPPGALAPLGGTPYATTQAGSDPGPSIMEAPLGNTNSHLRLTAATANQLNAIAFAKTDQRADFIQATFDFRIKDSGNNADGLAFAILDSRLYGNDGRLLDALHEEPNLRRAFGIGVDTYDNNEEGVVDVSGCGAGGRCSDTRANHISLHWDGAIVGEFKYLDRADFDLVNGVWNSAHLLASAAPGGMDISLIVRDGTDGSEHLLFDDVFVAGMSFPDGARAAFGGRTGSSASEQSIDNVNIRWSLGVQFDLSGDGAVNLGDANALRDAVADQSTELKFDIDGNQVVNELDLAQFLELPLIFNSYVGDVNLDGLFNSRDLVEVFKVGEYEDGMSSNSTWAEGDWNGDDEFDSSDLAFALQRGGYEEGPRSFLATLPEPNSASLLAIGALFLVRRRVSGEQPLAG